MNSMLLKLAACFGFLVFTAQLHGQEALYFEVATRQVYGQDDLSTRVTSDIRFACAMTRATDQLHLKLSDLHFNMMGTEVNLQETENVSELNFYYLWKETRYQLTKRDTLLILDALAESLTPYLLPLTITPDMFRDNKLVILNEGPSAQFDRETLALDQVQRTDDLLSADFKISSFSKILWEESLNQAKSTPESSTIGENEITMELPDGKVIITGEMIKHGKYLFHLKDNALEQVSFDRMTMPFEITLKDPSEKMTNEFSFTINRIRK